MQNSINDSSQARVAIYGNSSWLETLPLNGSNQLNSNSSIKDSTRLESLPQKKWIDLSENAVKTPVKATGELYGCSRL